MQRASIWRWSLALCVLLGAGILQAQDLYVEQSIQMPSMGGQPPQEMLMKLWVTQDKMRVDQPLGGGMTLIMRTDLDKMWIINGANKSYMERPLADAKKGAATAAKMMGGEKMQVDVKATGNTKKIGEWNCQEYLLSVTGGMPITMQLWVTPDIKIDPSLYTKMNEAMGSNPMMSPMTEKIKSIPGYPIETVAKMAMGGQAMETTTTAKKISQDKIDPAAFDLPAGLTKMEAPAPGPGAAPAPGAAPTPGGAPGTPAPKKGGS